MSPHACIQAPPSPPDLSHSPMRSSSSVPLTADSVLISGLHGRVRRRKRNITKVDLQRARRYGMCEPAHHGRQKYTYGGVCFVYDPSTNTEVTSWKSRDVDRRRRTDNAICGTRASPPILLERAGPPYDQPEILSYHASLSSYYRDDVTRWTSHCVVVADMSGSMRVDDVDGARCRSDGMWASIARDLVRRPLEAGLRSPSDLLSVVAMHEGGATVLVQCEPTGWVLYDRLCELSEWTTMRPGGHGNYGPALEEAERLLKMGESNESCAVALCFFSDGRPSDRGDFAGRTGDLAKRFGRRLSVMCIGMASQSSAPESDFRMLQNMSEEAGRFGSVAKFGRPSQMSASSISTLVSTVASSITVAQTELTDVLGRKGEIRTDVTREQITGNEHITGGKGGCADGDRPTDDGSWIIYGKKGDEDGRAVLDCWTWGFERNDFILVGERRCFGCWKDTLKRSRNDYVVCSRCGIARFCNDECYHNTTDCHDCDQYLMRKMERTILSPLEGDVMPSYEVAIKTAFFGEGAERIVRKLRFLDKDGQFIGSPMVAKESRFVKERKKTTEEEMAYHKEFFRTQSISSKLADTFNAEINKIYNELSPSIRRNISPYPNIRFLEPMILTIGDVELGGPRGEYDLLIEPMLEGKYEKFNNNMGYVKRSGSRGERGGDGKRERIKNHGRDQLLSNFETIQFPFPGEGRSIHALMDRNLFFPTPFPGRTSQGEIFSLRGMDSVGTLGIIEEGDGNNENHDHGGNDNREISFPKDELHFTTDLDDSPISDGHICPNSCDYEIPQAFSHFTYVRSRGEVMVVDLQGVATRTEEGNIKCFELTDPVVHMRDDNGTKDEPKKSWRGAFGRTNRGKEGMKAFFQSHRCSGICQKLGLCEIKLDH